MDSFLFEMVGLDAEPWSSEVAVDRLAGAAAGLGHTVAEGEGIGDWRKLELDGPLPTATLMVSTSKPGWALDLDSGVLGDEDDPTEERRNFVDLVVAGVGAAPLYLGTSVWPFGPETPPSYDTSTFFAATQAGSVMYVGSGYLEAILGGSMDVPKGWEERRAGPGRLLVVKGSLLREPDDPAVRRLLKRLQPSR